jgi:hypothetical protein
MLGLALLEDHNYPDACKTLTKVSHPSPCRTQVGAPNPNLVVKPTSLRPWVES